MGVDILKIISVFLFSTVKFAVAVPAAYLANFSFLKAMLITISGGTFGVLTFAFLSEWINKKMKRLFSKDIKKDKKKFTFTNKLIVRVKNYFGLIGISAITPILLSIPIGVFLAIRYYKNKSKVISYMIVSVITWAVILYFATHSFKNLF